MTASLARGLSPVRAELANGAVVLLQETVMTPAVTISASFKAGSMFDPADLPGVAYLTGRVIDRGTERRTAAMMADALDERGVSLRVSSNRQALTVSCTCLAEDFDDVLEIVADVVRNPLSRRESNCAVRDGDDPRQNEDTPGALRVDAVLSSCIPAAPRGWPSKGPSARLEGDPGRHGRISCAAVRPGRFPGTSAVLRLVRARRATWSMLDR